MLNIMGIGKCIHKELTQYKTKDGKPIYRGLFAVYLSSYLNNNNERIYKSCTLSIKTLHEIIKGEKYTIAGRAVSVFINREQEQFIQVDFPYMQHTGQKSSSETGHQELNKGEKNLEEQIKELEVGEVPW